MWKSLAPAGRAKDFGTLKDFVDNFDDDEKEKTKNDFTAADNEKQAQRKHKENRQIFLKYRGISYINFFRLSL